eukprot:CAMPEP_0173072176 /NCGR_PEP_ID=MMETSP1102-20130122/9661_1 /TAXON_ID=49646 /ORGANISM="Geminigera sp., Strain Caron Lab Isolate" /LENGTH=57 /DNA_ID=CAMNT_0013940795 /DNA_START=732 /DNA_END=902 /DNA_ORIENTATION=-
MVTAHGALPPDTHPRARLEGVAGGATAGAIAAATRAALFAAPTPSRLRVRALSNERE